VKSLFIGIFSLFLFTACGGVPLTKTEVKVGEQSFVCEVAVTESQRKKGLMFRETLAKNTGMLFDLQEEKNSGFWMKNTLIPLDIIWIGSDKKVLDVITATPCKAEPCEIIQSKSPARWILEINAGEFQGDIGDQVEFDL